MCLRKCDFSFKHFQDYDKHFMSSCHCKRRSGKHEIVRLANINDNELKNYRDWGMKNEEQAAGMKVKIARIANPLRVTSDIIQSLTCSKISISFVTKIGSRVIQMFM